MSNGTEYFITPRVPAARPVDPPNYDGIVFSYVFTNVTDAFVQPGVQANVTLVVANNQGFANGMTVMIENGGYYQVVSTDALNRMTVMNFGTAYNVSPGTTVAPGKVTTTSLPGPPGGAGPPGPQGIQGPVGPAGAGSTPSTVTPIMDSSAALGTDTGFARGDHVHPTDTSRAAVSAIPAPSSTNPVMDGAVAIGSSANYARADHVHPNDTSRVPFSGGAMTGVLALSGTVAGTGAAAGVVGEVITAAITSNQAMTTATTMNVGSISLTAGDWDVDGMVSITPSAAGPTNLAAGITTTSATLPVGNAANTAVQQLQAAFTTSVKQVLATGRAIINVSATTVCYLVAQATFASGNCQAQGFIRARRMR